MELTPKQEKFCQLYLELGNASEAYRQSYDTETENQPVVWVSACNLLASPKVALRVAELKALHAKHHKVTIASLIYELEEARLVAKGKQHGTAMVAATLGKAKLAGLDGPKEPEDKDKIIDGDPDV